MIIAREFSYWNLGYSIRFSNTKILQQSEFSSVHRNPSNSSRQPLSKRKRDTIRKRGMQISLVCTRKYQRFFRKWRKRKRSADSGRVKLEKYFFLLFPIAVEEESSVELLFAEAHEHEHEQKETSVGVEPWDLRASGDHVSPCECTLRRNFQLSFPYDNSFAISMIIDSVRRELSQVSNVLDTFSGIKRHLGRHFLSKSICR